MQQKNCGVEKRWRLMLYSMIEVSDGKISFASSSREFKETLNRIIFGSYGFFDDLKNSQSAGLECEFPAAYHFFLNQPNGE